ncbi:MAG: X-Pro dipeptidyl-peptidase [Mariniblastus sp.]|jgi:X-Pro dipeptidyl-peptidase
MSPYRFCLRIACVIALVSLCLQPNLNAQTTEQAVGKAVEKNPKQEPQKAGPIFKDGESQVVPAFNDPSQWIHHDLFVETEFDSDDSGSPDRMHVSVTRPKQTESEGLKVPVIYVTSPYFAGISSTDPEFMWDPKHELGAEPPVRKNPPQIKHQSRRPSISNSHKGTWVPRGFAVVHSCSPGTGLSQGCPTVGGINESLAPKAVIDWLCGRAKGYTSLDGNEEVTADWCSGKVGMTGTSYNGTLPIAAASTGVEGLEAIIPIAPNTSYYHYYRANGLVRHPGGYLGEDVDVLYNFIHSGDPGMREKCDCDVRDKEMMLNQDRKSGDYNDFWKGRDYTHALGPYKAATLMAHGFNDWNVMPSHTIRIHEVLKKKGIPLQTYLHQGGHRGYVPMKLMNRWFTRYLHGVENDVEKDAKSWVVREDARPQDPTPYEQYPNPEAELVTLHLNQGGNKSGQLTTSAKPGQGTESLIDDVGISGSGLAKAVESQNRLLYSTPILNTPLHLSGTSKLTIKVASDKSAANLSVWMVSLPFTPSMKLNDNIITRGWADPQNHKSLTESEELVPGDFYELSFDLEPDDQIIPAGQQIGLMIFSSDRDFTLWPAPGTELTVDLDATSIQIPVVGGAKALTEATAK